MMLILSMRLVSMLIKTDLESFLVEIFRHTSAKVLVYCNHTSDIRITEVDQLLPQRLKYLGRYVFHIDLCFLHNNVCSSKLLQ